MISPTRIPSDGQSDQRGFTLVELIVYMLLMVVILSLVGGMLVSSSRTQASVGNTAESSNVAQIISTSLRTSISSATAFSVTTNVSAGTQFVRARTADGSTTAVWSCQAWFFTGDSIYTKRTAPAAVIAEPTVSTLSGWTKLGGGLSKIGSTEVFAGSDILYLTFQVTTGNATPVRVDTSAARPKTTPAVSAPCY